MSLSPLARMSPGLLPQILRSAAPAQRRCDSDVEAVTITMPPTPQPLHPTGEGTLRFQVPADVAVDAANNGNTASAWGAPTHTVTVDTVAPTSVTITGVPGTIQNSAFDVTITFSEDVTGFAADEIAFTNSGGVGDTAAAAATLKADSDDNDATYTATITPTGTGSLRFKCRQMPQWMRQTTATPHRVHIPLR